MKMVGRLALLWFAAVAAMTAAVATGLLWDSIDQSWLRDGESFWIRMRVVPVFEASMIAAIFSAMLPNALFGVEVIAQFERGNTFPATVGRRTHDASEAFFATSLVVLPLLFVFPVDERALWKAEHMSRSQYLWAFFSLWLVHGALNAWAVERRRRRLEIA